MVEHEQAYKNNWEHCFYGCDVLYSYLVGLFYLSALGWYFNTMVIDLCFVTDDSIIS